MMSKLVGSAGIIAALIGAILLFYYGPPGRLQPGELRLVNEPQAKQLTRERRHRRLGGLGLVLIILGSLAEFAGVWLP